jgi:hypothetical protein
MEEEGFLHSITGGIHWVPNVGLKDITVRGADIQFTWKLFLARLVRVKKSDIVSIS